MAEFRIGTCSWADRSLLSSGWYPKGANGAASRLRHYSLHFNCVEVNSTFYAIPAQREIYLWMARTPPDFLFSVKAFALLTLHTLPIENLPRWLGGQVKNGKKLVTLYDFTRAARKRLLDAFLELVAVLHSAGRLGYLLFQLPPRIRFEDRWLLYLKRIRELTLPLPIAVEVRHRSWLEEGASERFLDFLRDENVAYVAVDEPELSWTVPPLWPLTASWGTVVRLHGRNVSGWRKAGASVEERFSYLYTVEELAQWKDQALLAAQSVPRIFIMFNNCYRDYAVKNALQMKAMLGLAPWGETAVQAKLSPLDGSSSGSEDL